MNLRVGTRRSLLARTQAGQACDLLSLRRPQAAPELVAIETTGDRVRDRPLREAGGKGLFVKELDEALLDGRIDCAVHSLKDVPTVLPAGITIAAVPERADPRDLLVTRTGVRPEDLPAGSVVGTTSARRAAQLLAIDPSHRVEVLRGNVETRLRRLIAGDFDATFLAAAGIARLGIELAPAEGYALDPFEFIPSAGQGALCFTAREGDHRVLELLATIEDRRSRAEVEAERALARVLGGSCFLPVGAFARAHGDALDVAGIVASEDGLALVRRRGIGSLAAPQKVGESVGRDILAGGGQEIVALLSAAP